VDEQDDRRHRGARRQLVAAELERLEQLAQHQGDDRPQAQRLLDHGVDVGRVAREALQAAGLAHEALDRPGQRGRGRLVAGRQQGHELVAQLGVGHRLALLVAGEQQHREHVVALGQVGRRAALRDQRVELAVDGAQVAPAHDPAHDRVLEAQHRDHDQRARVAGPVDEALERRAQARHRRAVLDPEDGAHDDLERDRLRVRAQREGLAGGQRRDGALGRLAHDRAVALDAFAVEGRQHELALAHVLVAVQQEERVGPERGAQDLVRLAGVGALRDRR
jgi:hypothetical protein